MSDRRSYSRVALFFAAIGCIAAPVFAAPEKPTRGTLPPAAMPALRPAVIDNTLAIGGEDIDARKVRTRMTVAVEVNGRGPYQFVVDSGADSSVVGTRIASALKLPPGTPAILNGMTATSRIERVLVDELKVGDTGIKELELPVLQERHLGGDGMIGIDALVEQRLMMDFEKRLIKVEDARRPPPRFDGEIVVTAYLRRGQLIITQARANGRPVDAVIDTGSEITIGNFALREQIVRRRVAKLETVEVTGVTGFTVELEMARIAELRLGPVLLRGVSIAFAEVPPFAVFGLSDRPALLLGTDLMNTFRRVSLDFRARKVRFQLRRCQMTGVRIGTGPSPSLARLGAASGSNEACGQ